MQNEAPADAEEGISLSEVLSALSHALDITEGQPEGHAVRSCLIGMRLAEEVGLGEAERSALFYALLLKDAGCSSNAARTCALFGADDLRVKREWKRTDWQRPWEGMLHLVRNAGPGTSILSRGSRVLGFVGAGVGTELLATRCERGAEVARMLGFGEETATAIRALDEHWNGAGGPVGLRGEEIPLLARIACLAQTLDIFHSAAGPEEACRVARERAGRWFDPSLVRALESAARDGAIWRGLSEPGMHDRVRALEPEGRVLRASDERLDRVAEAFAVVIDAKSPYTFRHSERVAQVAVAIGGALGMRGPELRELHRAGRLHDIGKLGVSNLILDKPGPLDDRERASIRRHPEHTLRILERVGRFRPLAEVAASHHERMDGGGYHRGLLAGELPDAARALAVADVYEALSAERPYREALPRERVLEIMRAEAGPGICPECFSVLESLGDPLAPDVPRSPPEIHA